MEERTNEIDTRPADAPPADVPLRDVVAPIERELARVRAASRRKLLLQAFGFVGAVYVLGGLGVGLADFLLRLPEWLRVGFWLLGVGVLIGVVRRWWLPAWRFRPSLTDVALRLERTPQGREAGLNGVLGSGLDLAAQAHEGDVESALSRGVVQDAADRLAKVRARGVLLKKAASRAAMVSFAAALLPVALLAFWVPSLSMTGARRVLTPWSSAAWPRRTEIVDAVRIKAHPIGTALPLRAMLTRTPRAVGATDVLVRYRLDVGGRAGPERTMLLTSQGVRTGEELGMAGTNGELFERLFEPSVLTGVGNAREIELVYRFETLDHQTSERRVLLVEPPSVRSAQVTIEPPAYAKGRLREGGSFIFGARDAGTGADQRSQLGPILAGSRVRLDLDLSKPLAGPADNKPGTLAAFVAGALHGLEGATNLVGSFSESHWSVEWTLDSSRSVQLVLQDEHGIRGADDPHFRFEVVDDKPPGVSVVDPAQDESLLATAVVAAAAEARDDVAIRSIELWLQRAQKPADSQGASAEAVGEAVRAAHVDGPPIGETARVGAEITLATMDLKAGDELWLTGIGLDAYELDGTSHAPITSGIRRLKIISETELVEQVRGELATLRESAIRLEKEQQRLAQARGEASRDSDAAARQSADQGAVKDRLGPMDDAVRRLNARIERNRLDDQAIRGVLNDAAQLLEEAARGADEAKRALDELKRPPSTQEERDTHAASLEKSQDQVEAALDELANMLDSGKDSWAVKRQLERLLAEQRQLESQTRSSGEQTRGKSDAELSQREREDLERLAARQRELAQQASAAIEAMRERGQQLSQADPGQSQAMKQATSRAQQQQLEEQQREAANRIQQNKTGEAEPMQQQASKTIEQMLQDLDDVQRLRDESLRRMLAEVIDSLRRLVDRQQGELDSLGTAVLAGSDALKGLDAGMIGLHRDTLAVLDRVAEQMRGADRLEELLGAAGDAESQAVTALRLSPPDASEADEQERISLTRLREALAEAERVQNDATQRDLARKRGELLKQYREALEEQLAIYSDAKPLERKSLNRKERNVVRSLGTREAELREKIAGLRENTKELGEAKVFDVAHKRLDRVMDDAGKGLGEGTVASQTTRQLLTGVEVLRSLVDALKDSNNKDEFRNSSEGGGGGGGGGSKPKLLPPIAELKLLRGMQAEAAGRTRAISDSGEGDNLSDIADLQGELESLGRELIREMNPGHGGDEEGPAPAPPEPKVQPGESGGSPAPNIGPFAPMKGGAR